MKSGLNFAGIVSLGLLMAGCGPSASSGRDQHSHAHVAPHGGQVVELRDGTYHLEFVFHPEEGMLHVYVLDRELERYVRIDAPELEFSVKNPVRGEPLTLKATANAVTGETVGNSSLFEASAEWLKRLPGFEAVLRQILVRGESYENISVRVMPAEEDHDHGHDHTHQH